MALGHTIQRYTTVTSTNDIAWQYAGEERNHGLVVVAEEQTQGRGRRGDTWRAPPGSSLLLSLLLKPGEHCRKPSKLTLWAGLVVCHVLETHLGLMPQLKWPNDVLINGKKVCGILVEQRREWVVVGVGLNVAMPAQWLQTAQLTQAGSLNEMTSTSIDREQLLRLLLNEWDMHLLELETKQDDTMLDWWAKYSRLVGKELLLDVQGTQVVGRLVSLGWDEISLEVEGNPRRFLPETIGRLQLAR